MKKAKQINSLKSIPQTKKIATYRLGKAEARERFAPLVKSLATDGGVIEITDYGKTAAVMLGYQDYMLLKAKAHVPLKSQIQLRGSAQLVGDFEEASKEISKLIIDSVNKTAAQL